MTIDELEAFVAVARASSIGAAAKRLCVPQATLSDRLRHLEARLGRLFQRRSRPPWLSWPANQGRDPSAVVASLLAFADDSLK